jgi:limonene-1,2-epoxide hydrolase
MGAAEERIALEFLSHGHGTRMDIDAMAAMLTEDFVWYVNASRKPFVGCEAAREELARQVTMSSGALPGSEIHNVASNGGVVFTERTDIFEMDGKRIRFPVTAVLEVVDGRIAAWREYYDTVYLARQLGVDPSSVVEE